MARRISRGAKRSNVRLKAALYAAITSLKEADGRASGLKFNKLMFELDTKYHGTPYAIGLPFRWYLYGAVVDDFEVHDFVSFDHLDDELRTNVNWVGGRPPRMSGDDSAAYSEYMATAGEFARRYPLNDRARWEMLRDHYAHAPEQFQRDFLEWEMFSRQLKRGYITEKTGQALGLLDVMIRSYPVDLEPRLTPAFFRLTNIVRHRLEKREPNETRELAECRDLMWEFWSVLCDFISIKHNSGVSEARLSGYHRRAEDELLAYKRTVQRTIEEFWRANPPKDQDPELVSRLRRHAFKAILEDLSEE